jgi:hypothetical protein
MKKKTAEFVDATDLFEGCDKAWDYFCDSDPDCSWGNNNRTLVTADTIFDALHDFDGDVEDEEEEELGRQIDTVLERVKELGDDFYVDLEN